MNTAFRIGLASAVLVLGLALAGSATASGQVRFQGTFRGPHGAFSIGVGDPDYPVGSYVPYDEQIAYVPRLGYGFYGPVSDCDVHHARHAHWIPVRHYGSRWIVVERPVVIVERRPYRSIEYDDYGYADESEYAYRDSRPYYRRAYPPAYDSVPYGGNVHREGCFRHE